MTRAGAGSSDAAGRGDGLRFGLALLVPLVAGAALRLYRLDVQVPTGDELHSVNAALARTTGEILRSWTYAGADYCVPLTALYRLALDAGLVLGEMQFRLPVLASGLVAVVALPALMRARLGDRAAHVLAWLIAISPLLVLYGRMIRSYMPAVLMAALALIAFERWWRRPRAPTAVGFVAAAVAAVWLHLGTASIVFAPFVWALGEVMLGGRDPAERSSIGPRLARLAGLGAAALAGVAVVLWPARASLLELVGLHGGGRFPGPSVWLEVARLQLGSASPWIAALAALAALRGAWLWWRRDRAWLALLVVTAAVHALTLAVQAPYLLESPVVFDRYWLPLLPFTLAAMAVGACEPLAARPLRSRAIAIALPAALVLLLALGGPLVGAGFRGSVFTHSNPRILFTGPPDSVPDDALPRFYRELASKPDGALVELPALNVATHAFDAYQAVHGRALRLGSLNELHGDARVDLRTLLSPTPERLLASDARYVVLHLDLRAEEANVRTREYLHAKRLAELESLWQVLERAGRVLGAELESSWGAPDHEEPGLRVWDLEAVRARRDAAALATRASTEDT